MKIRNEEIPLGRVLSENEWRSNPDNALHKMWPTLYIPCSTICGLKSNILEVSAPYMNKPALRVRYNLSVQKEQSILEEAHYYISTLQPILGRPKEELWKGQNTTTLTYTSEWEIDRISIHLSVLEDIRDSAYGKTTASLFFFYIDESDIAQPFVEILQRQTAEEFAGVESPSRVTYYNLGKSIYLPFDITPDSRLGHKSLYKNNLLETPLHILSELTDKNVALWQAKEKIYISTVYDTIRIDNIETSLISFCKIHPAKGSGQTNLTIGEMNLVDTFGCNALDQLVTAIEDMIGVKISVFEDYDY